MADWMVHNQPNKTLKADFSVLDARRFRKGCEADWASARGIVIYLFIIIYLLLLFSFAFFDRVLIEINLLKNLKIKNSS